MRLYQLAAKPANGVFHDVTVASSGVSGCALTTPSMCNNSTPSPTGLAGGLSGYLVTTGFDEVTGLGSIDGANLLANWVPGATFTISATPSTQTISIGGTATITITVTPQGNYTSPITFTATLTPTSTAQVTFNPITVTPNGSSATTTLTIQGATSIAMRSPNGTLASDADGLKLSALNPYGLWTPIGIAGLFLLGRRKKRDPRVLRHLLLSATLGLIALTMFSCGGGGSPPPPRTRTYQVQITATAAASPDGSSGAVTTSKTVSFTAQ
jgi:pseudomonalisin